jgi:hypothetical protein
MAHDGASPANSGSSSAGGGDSNASSTSTSSSSDGFSKKSLDGMAEQIAASVKSIFNTFEVGHGAYRGTHEETITSAQGAIMINDSKLVRNAENFALRHDKNAAAAQSSLHENLLVVWNCIGFIKEIDEPAAIGVSKILNPITNYAQATKNDLKMTLDYAAALQESEFKDRLSGIYFVTGPRNSIEQAMQSLASKQFLSQINKAVRRENKLSDSIYPHIPNSNINEKTVQRRVMETPLNALDQSVRLGPIKNDMDQRLNSRGSVPGSPYNIVREVLKKKL